MKRIILAFVFLSLLVSGGEVCAQDRSTDGFFKSNYEMYRDNSEWGTMPLLPSTHGYEYDHDADPNPAPLGSGLLLLGAMGIGYLAVKKKD
mgnify:FL=1